MYHLLNHIATGLFIMVAVATVYAPIFFLLKKRISVKRQLSFVLLAGSIVVVLIATIFTTVRWGGLSLQWPNLFQINIIPFAWLLEPYAMGMRATFTQLAANILLFVPLGFLFPIVFAKFRTVLATMTVVFFFSLSIEICQLFIGRSADIDDLITNTIGGGLGYLIFTCCHRTLQAKSSITHSTIYQFPYFAVVADTVTLISGRYSDTIKESELIIALGYCIIGLGFFLYTIADSVWFLFGIQALIGLGEAIYSPTFDAIYSKYLDGERSGAQWGIWESANYFSIAIGAIIGGTVVTWFGFSMLFIIMGSLCFVSGLYILSLNRDVL